MSEPMTHDLQHAFDDLVGDARPGADLAARARVRGTTLRRQRMAGGLAVVAVTGALCVPGLALVRDQAQGGNVGASFAGQPNELTPTKAAGATSPDKTKSADTAKSDELKRTHLAADGSKSIGSGQGSTDRLGSGVGEGPTSQTHIQPGVLTALDNHRLDAAQALLPGSGWTVDASDVAVDATSGAHLGAAVTFSAPGGGQVAIEWSTGEHSISAGSGAGSATIGPKDGTDGAQVSGAVLVQGDTEWDLKILQGPAGSTPILATPAVAAKFLTQLASAP